MGTKRTWWIDRGISYLGLHGKSETWAGPACWSNYNIVEDDWPFVAEQIWATVNGYQVKPRRGR